MSTLLRVLIIEDAQDDADLLALELKHGGYQVHYRRVDSAEAMRRVLEAAHFDAVIADYVLPGFSGLEALAILKEMGLDLPFIMVSGKMGEETAVEAMRAGAHDYLLKGNLTRLVPAIEREIGEAAMRREQRRSERELRSKLDFVQVLIDTIPTPIFYNDTNGIYLGCNRAFEEHTGLQRGEIINRSVHDVLPLELGALFRRGEDALRGEGINRGLEGAMTCADGARRDVIFYSAPFKNSDSTIGGIVCAIFDISERKASEMKLRYMSTHDMLTGIYNRAYFDEELMRLKQGRHFPISIVMADVDGLKEMNDEEGHAAGDALLKRAADVLRSSFRREDVVARVGGDEFAAILPGTEEAALDEAMERLEQSLAAHNKREGAKHLRLSIGAATASSGEGLMDAWRLADERMYRQKKGRTRRMSHSVIMGGEATSPALSAPP
ncbi:diguanylate cyclase [Geomonas sp. RF6]|uniref:GGDEF domain-containing response regulator n=1 Tax=Geomonas sp. RF6 TaxID=2897342 RepID=UPI001E44F39A|nr:GGDEF domain-containing response regulator [Geomonas sp. RF6]UFS71648.1 diguanylate cyclase [Geomonas sp. RF6]